VKKTTSVVFLMLAVFVGGCETAETAKPKFLRAIEQNDGATAISLLTKFPELAKATNDAGVPVLCLALGDNSTELIEPLLNAGADPNAAKPTPPLLLAMDVCPHPHEVALLVQYGADVNVVSTAFGLTPLMEAANFGDLESVKALAEKGADVNAKDTAGGLTVLHHAVYGANADVVTYLLQKGASVDAKDNDGQTALQLALAASAPVKSDQEIQKEIERLAQTNPAAAAKLSAQRIVRASTAGPLRGKDLSKVITALRQRTKGDASR
jgi:ankyrin repeat protein